MFINNHHALVWFEELENIVLRRIVCIYRLTCGWGLVYKGPFYCFFLNFMRKGVVWNCSLHLIGKLTLDLLDEQLRIIILSFFILFISQIEKGIPFSSIEAQGRASNGYPQKIVYDIVVEPTLIKLFRQITNQNIHT